MKLSNDDLAEIKKKLHAHWIDGRLSTGVRDGLIRYLEHGICTGSFLTALLTNDLCGAVSKADQENYYLLKETVGVLWNDLPSGVWGSTNNFEAHIKANKTKVDEATTEG